MTLKNIFRLLFILAYTISFSQEIPPIQNYTPEVYNAENQNWSISQSKDNLIYAANNKGLLEYNGAEWQLYLSKQFNNQICKSN